MHFHFQKYFYVLRDKPVELLYQLVFSLWVLLRFHFKIDADGEFTLANCPSNSDCWRSCHTDKLMVLLFSYLCCPCGYCQAAVTVPWDHRLMGAVGPHSSPALKAGPPQGGCPGLCSVWVWMSPRMESPKFSGPVFDYRMVKSLCLGFLFIYFFMLKGNFMCSRFCLLLLVLSVSCNHREESGSFSFAPSDHHQVSLNIHVCCSLWSHIIYRTHFFPLQWLQTASILEKNIPLANVHYINHSTCQFVQVNL